MIMVCFFNASLKILISVMCAILKQYMKFLQGIDMVQKLQFYVIDSITYLHSPLPSAVGSHVPPFWHFSEHSRPGNIETGLYISMEHCIKSIPFPSQN